MSSVIQGDNATFPGQVVVGSLVAGQPIVAALTRLSPAVAPAVPEDGDMWNDSDKQALSARLAGITQVLSGSVQVNPLAFTGSADEAPLIAPVTLPADFFTVGKTLRAKIYGHWSFAAAAVNVTLRLSLGTAVVTLGPMVFTDRTAQGFMIEGLLTCLLAGELGSFAGCLRFENASEAALPGVGECVQATGINPIDTTLSHAYSVSAQFNTADPGAGFECVLATLEVLN